MNEIKSFIVLICVLLLGINLNAGAMDAKQEPVENGLRIAWLGGHKHDKKVLQAAKELNFDAVVVYWDKEKTVEFIKLARSYGLDTYTWIFPTFPDGDKNKYKQQMTKKEDLIKEQELALAKEKKLFFSGHQSGGEYLPNKKDVLIYDIPCFHHQEVLEVLKIKVKEILETAPELKGVALDMFGYQNYNCCYCPASMKAFAEYRKKHPAMSQDAVWKKFNLETLVSFQNELCDYARTVRENVKITNHVWPVYMPEPLYGNRLNVDYCAQTAAWFFEPFWKGDKISSHSKKIVSDAGKYYKHQQGIPFIGYYNRDDYPVKSPERLAHEIELILENSPDGSLAIYNFTDIVNTPEALAVVKGVLKKQLVNSKNLSEWEGMVIPNTQFMHSGTNSLELFGKYPTELITSHMIPIDMNKSYTLSAWMRTLDAKLPASGYLGLRMYDKDKKPINITNVKAFAGTESSLSEDAVKGTKELHILKNPKYLEIKTSLMMFNIKDEYQDLPNYDCSPRITEIIDEGDFYKVILSTPLNKSYSAGTRMRLHSPWGAPFYWLTEGWHPAEWTKYTNIMKGESQFGTPKDKFWKGTKYVRVFVWFGNWNNKPEQGAKLLVDDIRFIED